MTTARIWDSRVNVELPLFDEPDGSLWGFYANGWLVGNGDVATSLRAVATEGMWETECAGGQAPGGVPLRQGTGGSIGTHRGTWTYPLSYPHSVMITGTQSEESTPPRRWFVRLLAIGTAASCSGPTTPDSGPASPRIPDVVDCSAFPESGNSPYVLPFAVGQRFTISRTFEHYALGNEGVGLYAIDIPMPVGTAVHAIRSGVVVAVEERFSNEDHADYHENWVMVRHADGTVARYIHLTTNGALVGVGDVVLQGDVVGLSGNSGASTAPHLHFDVQTCGPNLPPGYNTLPCGMTAPLSFRNTESHSCGLEAKKAYTAFPFTSVSQASFTGQSGG